MTSQIAVGVNSCAMGRSAESPPAGRQETGMDEKQGRMPVLYGERQICFDIGRNLAADPTAQEFTPTQFPTAEKRLPPSPVLWTVGDSEPYP